MSRTAALIEAIHKPINPEQLKARYAAMRKRHAQLSSQEHKHVSGQGCIDTYPRGWPV